MVLMIYKGKSYGEIDAEQDRLAEAYSLLKKAEA